jgi:hypothetical protein
MNDACQICHGLRGGMPGNNVVNGVVMCDYCHAVAMATEDEDWDNWDKDPFERGRQQARYLMPEEFAIHSAMNRLHSHYRGLQIAYAEGDTKKAEQLTAVINGWFSHLLSKR